MIHHPLLHAAMRKYNNRACYLWISLRLRYGSLILLLCFAAVSGGPGSSPELEVTDVVSIGSALSSNQQSEDGQYEIDKRLYLVKYDSAL